FLLGVVILDAGDLVALRVGEHARDGRERAHLGAGLLRVSEVSDQRIGERPGRTTDVAPAVVNASRPALVIGRIHADAAGTRRMPAASQPLSQTSPWRKVFIGGIG